MFRVAFLMAVEAQVSRRRGSPRKWAHPFPIPTLSSTTASPSRAQVCPSKRTPVAVGAPSLKISLSLMTVQRSNRPMHTTLQHRPMHTTKHHQCPKAKMHPRMYPQICEGYKALNTPSNPATEHRQDSAQCHPRHRWHHPPTDQKPTN